MKTLLLERFFRQATDRPDQPAIVDRRHSISYHALLDQSLRVASFLTNRGIGPGARVAVLLDKSIEAVVAILGTLQSGAAYVPLDVGAPLPRIRSQLQDCQPGALFARAQAPVLAAALPDPGTTVVTLGGPARSSKQGSVRDWDEVQAVAPLSVPSSGHSGDPAYLLYTSGSTGEPKGVVVSHRAAEAFVNWAADFFEVGPSDRVSSHAPFHFDLSIFDLFASIGRGATVVLVPRELSAFPASLAGFIEEQQITVWYSVPTILAQLGHQEDSTSGLLQSLRLVLFAGEVFPTRDFLSLRAVLPETRFFNLYGPTETNVCTFHPVGEVDPDQPIPIGRPCPYARVFVLQDDGRPAGPGERGELWVTGDSLMSGYWNRQSETRRVMPSRIPAGIPSGSPVYRTGDLVRLDSRQNLVFSGRSDSMVKRRGYRIELGEIESVLCADSRVREAAVLAVSRRPPELRIEAFVAFEKGQAGSGEMAREILRRNLPDYMLPDRVHLLEELPRNSRSKLDREKLRRMAVTDSPH